MGREKQSPGKETALLGGESSSKNWGESLTSSEKLMFSKAWSEKKSVVVVTSKKGEFTAS